MKPELFRHEGLFEAERSTKLPLRVAFSGLFTVADREGRFRWRPRVLKLDVLPFDELDFEEVLSALVERGFIRKYQVDGEWFAYIPTFLAHQVINQREARSSIPAPPDKESPVRVHGLQVHSQESHAQESERMCMHVQAHGEGKGKGREKEKEQIQDAGASGVFTLPSWIPEKPWAAFLEMRAKMRRPFTNAAKKLIVANLEKLKAQGENVGSVLEASVANGWAGVFAVRRDAARGSNRKPTNAVNSNRGTNFSANLTDVGEL